MPEAGLLRPHYEEDDYKRILECVHCGLCLANCPTYRILGVESDSPRGRIYLMKAAAEGRLEITPDFERHMYQCLNCRNCEAVCPSGVKFGEVMGKTRDEIEKRYPRGLVQRVGRKVALDWVFPHPSRLRLVFTLGRYAQRLGLQGLLGSKISSMLPPIPSRFFHSRPDFSRPPPGDGPSVGFLSGCVMSTLFAHIDEATVRVLERNGCRIHAPPDQTCCGAVHEHSGDLDVAKKLARKNIDSFDAESLDAIVVNSAGCGATMKEYARLLKDDRRYAEKARVFSQKVRDISEFLYEKGLDGRLGEVRMKVTYQDPCHLAHAQRITKQPRQLIRKIPGIELVEMRDSDQCCGAAGVYNILNYDLSLRILEPKVANIREAGAETIIASNPPCLIQMHLARNVFGLSAKPMHIVELLDMAYQTYDTSRGKS